MNDGIFLTTPNYLDLNLRKPLKNAELVQCTLSFNKCNVDTNYFNVPSSFNKCNVDTNYLNVPSTSVNRRIAIDPHSIPYSFTVLLYFHLKSLLFYEIISFTKTCFIAYHLESTILWASLYSYPCQVPKSWLKKILPLWCLRTYYLGHVSWHQVYRVLTETSTSEGSQWQHRESGLNICDSNCIIPQPNYLGYYTTPEWLCVIEGVSTLFICYQEYRTIFSGNTTKRLAVLQGGFLPQPPN